MNLPTYEAIEAMIKLDQSQPVSIEEWKRRVFGATIETVKMMNRDIVDNKTKESEPK